MIKKLLSTSAIFLLVMSVTAAAQPQIGYMDTQEVLSQLPEREQVQKELESFIQKKQQELSDRAAEYQDEVAQYQQNREGMSQQQIEQREQELTKMQNSLDQFNQTIRQQVQQKRQDLLAPIFDRIDQAIRTVAQSQDLDFVLNRATTSGDRLIFYASGNQSDITQSVIDELTSSQQN